MHILQHTIYTLNFVHENWHADPPLIDNDTLQYGVLQVTDDAVALYINFKVSSCMQ